MSRLPVCRVCHCAGWKQLKEMLLVLVFAGLCIKGGDIDAAPVTFRFDAEIHTVFPGNPFDSGIDFAAGDVITGRFTFEPNPGDGSNPIVALQTHQFQLNINGVAIAAPNYEIESFDDYSIEDFPDASIIDTLKLAGAGLTTVDASAGLNFDPLQSTFLIDLRSAADEHDQAYIPADSDVWNQFNLWRSLRVILRDGEGGAVPHYTTLQKASCRLLAAAPARRLLDATVQEHMGRKRRVRRVAIDSTGLESSAASAYFVRVANGWKCRGKPSFIITFPSSAWSVMWRPILFSHPGKSAAPSPMWPTFDRFLPRP
jgi:hypothetical protein